MVLSGVVVCVNIALVASGKGPPTFQHLHSPRPPTGAPFPICMRHTQIANAMGFLPGCLLFSAFGQSGTSIIRALLDGETSSAEFIQSIIIIVVGLLVVVVTVMMVRRTINRLRKEQAEEAARGTHGSETASAEVGAGDCAVQGLPPTTGVPKYGVSGPSLGEDGVQLATGQGSSAAPASVTVV